MMQWMPGKFPGNMKRFSDKNCSKNKKLVRLAEPDEVKDVSVMLRGMVCFFSAVVVFLVVWERTLLAAPVETLPQGAKIVVIGGALSEIVYALGASDQMIGRDTTSNFPAAILSLPDVGYMRALSPEGVLSLKPEGLLLVEGSGPPQALDVLSQASVPMVFVPENYSRDGVLAKIEQVGRALHRETQAQELIRQVRDDFSKTADLLADLPQKKRVLFVLSVQNGRIMAAGDNTAADGMIELAGGVNAFSGKFSGYKLINDEELIGAAPDFILSMSNRAADYPLLDELRALPAVKMTPAGKEAALHQMEGLFLLGFGPRTAQAARDVAQMLYGASLPALTHHHP